MSLQTRSVVILLILIASLEYGFCQPSIRPAIFQNLPGNCMANTDEEQCCLTGINIGLATAASVGRPFGLVITCDEAQPNNVYIPLREFLICATSGAPSCEGICALDEMCVKKAIEQNYTCTVDGGEIAQRGIQHCSTKLVTGGCECSSISYLPNSDKCKGSRHPSSYNPISSNVEPICRTIAKCCVNPNAAVQADFISAAEFEGCACSELPEGLRTRLPTCREEELDLNPPDLDVIRAVVEENLPGIRNAQNGRFTAYIQAFKGKVEELIQFPELEYLIPISSLQRLDIDELVTGLYNRLSVSKKCFIVRNTLGEDPRPSRIGELYDEFKCHFVSGTAVEYIEKYTPTIAQQACQCRDRNPNIRARVEKMCDVIHESIPDYNTFLGMIDGICAPCLSQILGLREEWKKRLLEDEEAVQLACNVIGSTPGDLATAMEWAGICETLLDQDIETCALLGLFSEAPTEQQLIACSQVLCENLCSLLPSQITALRKALDNSNGGEDLKCLAFLKSSDFPQVNLSPIPGDCPARSELLYKYINHRNSRKKRDTNGNCDIFCDKLADYADMGVQLEDIDVADIVSSSCLTLTCDEVNLGHFQWNRKQAIEILRAVKESNSLNPDGGELSGLTLEILGFISLGLTPEELRTLDGITTRVFEVYGAVFGWHPDQLTVLAERYMEGSRPEGLTVGDIAVMNHIICGLTRSQISRIPRAVIRNTTAILGGLRQCRLNVLRGLAGHLRDIHGEVDGWQEEEYSEFGIMNAGLKGREIASAGTRIVDHLTVPFINHVDPSDFAEMIEDQLELLNINLALAVERRNLCQYLQPRKRVGNLKLVCEGDPVRTISGSPVTHPAPLALMITWILLNNLL